ncbi:MAG: LPS assembly lipoprotein LptE [Cytophagales bacterium]|nr:LPS assembly lipoprotein LptE [Cytophagales bacterium]
MMNTQRRTLLLAISAASLTACGFKLRGSTSFSYAFQLLFSGFLPTSALGQEFKRQATAQGLTVLDKAEDANRAQVVLRVHQELRERAVVGSGATGQVNAIQLRLRFKFSLFTTQGKTLLDEVDTVLQREMSYSESTTLAKETEEQLLYNDMQIDMAQQLLRRLSAVKSL